MSATVLDVQAARRRFSSLQGGFAFLDAPGGSQVPDEVGEAIARTLREASANIGANYETSKRVEGILATAREDAARFLGCSSDDVVFGTNMTWLDFALSRTAARDWREGDRIHSPMYVSLRPPPYASAVSNHVMPASHAASMSSKACSGVSPWPKNAGAEPIPPKLPQPRMTRG